MRDNLKVKHITFISLMCAASCILSLLDRYLSIAIFTIIPVISAFTPYLKLGIANIIIVIMLYTTNFKESLITVLIKSILTGLIFSILTTFLIGFLGTILSFLGMCLLKQALKDVKYIMFVSMIGGFLHMIGQLIMCFILYGINKINNPVLVIYIPIILLTGLFSGLIIGLLSKTIMKILHKEFTK